MSVQGLFVSKTGPYIKREEVTIYIPSLNNMLLTVVRPGPILFEHKAIYQTLVSNYQYTIIQQCEIDCKQFVYSFPGFITVDEGQIYVN